MEVFNQDWKHQWDTFMSAPYIVAPFVIGGGFIGWWLKGIKSDNIINGLNGRIEIFGDRLTLAAQKVEAANQAKAEIERQFQVYKSDVAANKEHSALAATAAKVDA